MAGCDRRPSRRSSERSGSRVAATAMATNNAFLKEMRVISMAPDIAQHPARFWNRDRSLRSSDDVSPLRHRAYFVDLTSQSAIRRRRAPMSLGQLDSALSSSHGALRKVQLAYAVTARRARRALLDDTVYKEGHGGPLVSVNWLHAIHQGGRPVLVDR